MMTTRQLVLASGLLVWSMASVALAQDNEDIGPGVDTSAPAQAAVEPGVDTSATVASDIEPGVDTSRDAPEGQIEPGIDTSTISAANSSRAVDSLELGSSQIIGNQELPQVLYIVPWKSSDLGDLVGRPVNTLLDEVLAPADREVFIRQIDYYDDLHGDPTDEES